MMQVVGPEPITGSTRMKSGTATKMMLDVMLVAAFDNKLTSDEIMATIQNYSTGFLDNPEVATALSKVISYAGDVLHAGGGIRYIGMDTFGIVGKMILFVLL